MRSRRQLSPILSLTSKYPPGELLSIAVASALNFTMPLKRASTVHGPPDQEADQFLRPSSSVWLLMLVCCACFPPKQSNGAGFEASSWLLLLWYSKLIEEPAAEIGSCGFAGASAGVVGAAGGATCGVLCSLAMAIFGCGAPGVGAGDASRLTGDAGAGRSCSLAAANGRASANNARLTPAASRFGSAPCITRGFSRANTRPSSCERRAIASAAAGKGRRSVETISTSSCA